MKKLWHYLKLAAVIAGISIVTGGISAFQIVLPTCMLVFLNDSVTFTGSGNWTVPFGLNGLVHAEVIGSGGGAGIGNAGGTQCSGGGGGGGSTIMDVNVTENPGFDVAITIGSVGNGAAGGSSFFGASGKSYRVTGNGGAAGNVSGSAAAGGAAGTGGFKGGNGGVGSSSCGGDGGGGGGGGAGLSGAGVAGSGHVAAGAAGGAGGSGNPSSGLGGHGQSNSTCLNFTQASIYAAGAGGRGDCSGSTAAGAAGWVRVSWETKQCIPD